MSFMPGTKDSILWVNIIDWSSKWKSTMCESTRTSDMVLAGWSTLTGAVLPDTKDSALQAIRFKPHIGHHLSGNYQLQSQKSLNNVSCSLTIQMCSNSSFKKDFHVIHITSCDLRNYLINKLQKLNVLCLKDNDTGWITFFIVHAS